MTNNIHVRQVGSQLQIALITLRGFLDTMSAYRFQQQADDLIEKGIYQYVINLEWLDYISSAGLETLLAIAQKLSPHDGRLILVQVPAKIFKVFDIIGLTTFFQIRNNVRDALQELDNARAPV